MSWHVFEQHQAVACLAHLPDIPGAKLVRHTVRNVPVTLARHDYPTWLALRKAGLPVPAPLHYYDWPGRFDPRRVQRLTVEHLLQHEKAFVVNGLGTGKTLCAVWAADYLRQVGEVRRVLVVAPKSILENVWEREFFQTLPASQAVVLRGTRARKQQAAADTRFDYIIVNPESLHLIVDHLPEVDLVVVDEFTKFKNRNTQRWRALYAIARDKRLWLMSGTPAPQSPLDAYGPIKLVREERLTLRQWRDMTMFQVSQFTWRPRENADETIAAWMQPAVHFRLEDVTELPEVSVQTLEGELTASQKAMIAKLKEEALAELGDGREITAANAAAVISKILQVQCGAVYGTDEEGNRFTEKIDAKPYFEAIETVVEQADTPVLIFAPFRSAVEAIHQHLEAAGYRSARIMGGVENRGELFDDFRHRRLDALVAVAGTMSHGVDGLQHAGRYILWACPPYSFEEYDQANGRLLRSGQQQKVVIYHLTQSALDTELFARLDSKARLQDTVLNLLKSKI